IEVGLEGALKDSKAVGGVGELIKLLLKLFTGLATPPAVDDGTLRDRLTKTKTVLLSSWAKRVSLVGALQQAMPILQERLKSPLDNSAALLPAIASTLIQLRALCFALCQF